MKELTLNIPAGHDIYHTLLEAVGMATENDVAFTFNETNFTVKAGETFDSVKARWEETAGFDVLTPEESAEQARQHLAEMEARQAKEIADAGAMTEKQMQEAEPPKLRNLDGLTDYITSLVDRPHDYGTCVYAMSLAATAAFNFVASQLGVTGFQASCADLDIIRRTRGIKGPFRIVEYDNLLYPQYCDSERFPSHRDLLNNKDVREHLRTEAARLLAETEHASERVREHWSEIASDKTF